MLILKNDTRGIVHILAALLIIPVILTVGAFVVLRTTSSSNSSSDTQANPVQRVESAPEAATPEPDIVLSNLGVASIDDVLVQQQALRDFASNGLKGFYVFGDKLSGGRTNPNFEYASLKDGAKAVSAIDGSVEFIKEQSPGDFEVFIQPKAASAWTIGYDHVTNLAVKKGDTVKAGDIIGDPVMQNNGLTRFEMQINKDADGITTHYCPSSLLAESAKTTILPQLRSMLEQWESTSGLELYDIAAQNPIGCLKTTITSSEAEGR